MALSLIDALDIGLFNIAQCYDLSRTEERQRSVRVLEALFFRLVRELTPDLFIEAGALDGSTSRKARRFLPDAKITAFEANPYNYERHAVRFKAEPCGVDYVHLALSDSDGQVTFNVRVIDGKPSTGGQGSILKVDTPSVEQEEVTVNARRLDSYFKPDSFDRCAVWMDVEGASKQVLQGAEAILSKVDLLFIELEDRASWKGQWLAGEVMEHLAKFDLLPVARDFQSRYQYNVLFLNRRNLRNDRVRLFLASFISRARFGPVKRVPPAPAK